MFGTEKYSFLRTSAASMRIHMPHWPVRMRRRQSHLALWRLMSQRALMNTRGGPRSSCSGEEGHQNLWISNVCQPPALARRLTGDHPTRSKRMKGGPVSIRTVENGDRLQRRQQHGTPRTGCFLESDSTDCSSRIGPFNLFAVASADGANAHAETSAMLDSIASWRRSYVEQRFGRTSLMDGWKNSCNTTSRRKPETPQTRACSCYPSGRMPSGGP